MPFLGQDWRQPGEQWVKASDGWQKHRLWRLKLLEHLNENMVARLMKLSLVELDNTALQHHKGTCHQPHVFLQKPSKEQKTQGTTISDALAGLDMGTAVRDARRFGYVCKLLELLIEHKLCSLSGTAQRQLISLLEDALNAVLKTQTHMHVVRELLQALRTGLAAGEYHHVGSTSLWNNHIHTVERLQNALNSLQMKERESDGKLMLDQLPEECLWEILQRFTDSQDIINTGLSDDRLANLAGDKFLWQQLCLFHFDDKQLAAVMKSGQSLDNLNTEEWKKLHHRLTKRFGPKILYGETLTLCQNCRAIYWQHHGHPCYNHEAPSRSVPVSPLMCLELFTA